jgi:hypothetical protein
MPPVALYETMVTMGLDVSMYSSSLRHTALNIIWLNNLNNDFRSIQVIESLILNLIDRGFIRLIPNRVLINHHLTFLFSRAVQNPSVSSFLHPKEIFKFHKDLAKVFSNSSPFLIHPLMKRKINKAIKFLSRPHYISFPSWFSLFPIDQHYVNPHMKPPRFMPPVMESMVNDIINPTHVQETKLIK